ncbi:MAG TPA: hypothetical protein VK886_21065, partial [Vicinamibacterales bacterium]|nr:hypothetical protein [Vicinamibacterales bacterium]
MGRRVGIDLSAETIALADVSQRGGRVQLYGFALVEGAGEVALVAGDLRNARRKYGLSRRAEVVAWPDDPRVDAVRQAGFSVERVITPGEALARVAQMHHNGHPLGLTTAVVSLHVSSGALAVVHEGTLLHEARLTLPTGTGAVSSELLRRYAFLAELSERLRGSFADVRRSHDTSASEILTCGSLPELRSFTMPLADEFDIDVETLDALDDIEIKIRNLSPEQLRDRVAGLRVAIVAGRPSHLQPKRARRVARIAVPAGLAAAALLFLTIYGGSSLRPPARPQPAAAPGGAAGSPGHAATASGVAARRQGSPDVATREAPRRGATADQAPVARAAVPTTPARVEPQRGADASSDRAAGPVRIAGARVGTEAPERAASGQPTRAPAVSPAPVDSPEVRTREPLLRVSPSAVSPAPPPRQAAPPPRVASAPAPPPAAPRASAPATAAA